MIRSLASWFRVVLPPPWIVVIALLIYLLLETPFWICVAIGFRESSMLHARDALMIFACVAFAVFRAERFHPIYHEDYFRWLQLTPWNYRKPLPLGPIHLVPQDLLVVVGAMCLMHDSNAPVFLVPVLTLMAYIACIAGSLTLTGQTGLAYLLAFGIGLAIRVSWMSGIVALEILVVLYVICQFGLRKSFAMFPWEDTGSLAARQVYDTVKRELTKHRKDYSNIYDASALGWPFNLLSSGSAFHVGRQHYVLISLLVGWLAYAFLSCPESKEISLFAAMIHISIFTTVFPLVRLSIYCWNYRPPMPPINIWGRIFTLRWIIPSYDKVLVAPLSTFFVGYFVPWLLAVRLEVSPAIAIPISITVTMATLLLIGPSLREWRLTGNYRLVPAVANTVEFEEI